MKEPDFAKVFKTIAEIFSECDPSSFPIELGRISEHYSNLFKIRIFSDLEKSHYREWLKRVSGDATSEGIGTEDGFTIKDTVDDINKSCVHEREETSGKAEIHSCTRAWAHLYGPPPMEQTARCFSILIVLKTERMRLLRVKRMHLQETCSLLQRQFLMCLIRTASALSLEMDSRYTRARIIPCYPLPIRFQEYLASQIRLHRLESTALISIYI